MQFTRKGLKETFRLIQYFNKSIKNNYMIIDKTLFTDKLAEIKKHKLTKILCDKIVINSSIDTFNIRKSNYANYN